MIYVLKFIAAWLLPPGIFILMLAVLTYVLFKRNFGRVRYLALVLTLGLYLLSTSFGARLLALPLEQAYEQQEPEEAQLIVVLGGGSVGGVPDGEQRGNLGPVGAARLLTAARLATEHELPVLITGGQVFADGANEALISARILRDLGLTEAQIIPEVKARTTQENAQFTAELCRERGYERVLLVTSALHMPRSKYFFERYLGTQGVEIVTYPCDYTLNPKAEFSLRRFVPQQEALDISCSALHEYVGLIGGRLR